VKSTQDEKTLRLLVLLLLLLLLLLMMMGTNHEGAIKRQQRM
jgi:hypothetical protein